MRRSPVRSRDEPGRHGAGERQQPDRAAADQGQRIQVGLTPQQAPVQARCGKAVARGALEGADARTASRRAGPRAHSRSPVRTSSARHRGPPPRPRDRRALAAKVTVPASAVRTPWPACPSRSTPRWPAPHRDAGGSNREATAGRGTRGHTPSRAGAGSVAACAGDNSMVRKVARRRKVRARMPRRCGRLGRRRGIARPVDRPAWCVACARQPAVGVPDLHADLERQRPWAQLAFRQPHRPPDTLSSATRMG